MRNILIILILMLLNCSKIFACECSGRIGTNFMNNLKSFDVIVKGTILNIDSINKVLFVVERTYKGIILSDTLKLEMYTLCDLAPDAFENTSKWILGLESHQSSYSIPGCMSSFLQIEDSSVSGTISYLASLLRFNNRISLKRFEQKVSRKIKNGL